jgi:acetolactate synthase-1/2/3 large subunit
MYDNVTGAAAGTVRTGNRYLAEAMASSGLDHFFHMPLILPDAVKDMHAVGVRPVVVHSEKAAAYMADGYARASGKIGVCAAQAIGSSNLAAGMLDAYMAHAPILALTGGGTADTRYRNNYQEIDQQPIWGAITKASMRVEGGHRLPELLGQAMRVATSGAPGPVHLELNGFTGGVLADDTAGAALPDPRYANAPSVRQAAPAQDVEAALRVIGLAGKPIIIAGSGIRQSNAFEALRAFAHHLRIPVATSLDAKAALPESDPLLVGCVGTYSRETANKAVSEADLMIFVGTTTGSMVTATWRVPVPGVRAIQIDVDPRELGRNYPLEAGMAGDPATVLDQLRAAAPAQPDRSAWLARIADLKADWANTLQTEEYSEAVPIRPERLCRVLSDVLPEDAVLLVDTGHAAHWACRHIHLSSPRQTLLRPAGSLGWSYPASLGAKCAVPDRPVICFTGDGGFLYHLAEMETAVRYGINTVTIVNANNSLSQERNVWGGVEAFDEYWRFSPVDYAAAATAFGCKAWKVERPEDIAPVLREALAANAPAIVEVMTDDQILAPTAWVP